MIGWEEAAPLAEETEDPQRNVPIAMVGSIVAMGLLFVVCTWGVTIGFGTGRLDQLVGSAEAPAFVTAHRYWGDAGTVIVMLALLNSVIAASIACCNASTRMLFGMGRTGALPRWLAQVHPKLKTPVNAVYLQILLTFAVALIFGFAMGPLDYFSTFALIDTLAIGIVLILAMVGVFTYFWRQERPAFNWFKHLVLPVVGGVAVAWVLYKSLNPLPPEPVKWAAPATLGWILLGGVILWLRWRAHDEDWEQAAGTAPAEVPETPDEVAPAFE
jgi:amino acid transporter